jgi:translation initiation factor IF-2
MDQAKHTMVAGQAVSLAELFKYIIGKSHVIEADGTTYTPQMSAPEGPSTAGGKQALQHVTLVPANGSSTLVIGTAHLVDKHAELRSYGHVAAVFRQRFKGAPFSVPEGQYDKLIQQARSFFTERGFQVKVTEAPAAPTEARRASTNSRSASLEPSRQFSAGSVALIACAAALGAVILAYFMLR